MLLRRIPRLGELPPTSLHGIPEGIEGVRVTLATMARIVRAYRHAPIVAETARSIIAHVPEKNHVGEMLAIFSFVRDGVRYTMDSNEVERLQTPDYTLANRHGDCDDKSILLAALLESVGIPARFTAVGFEPDIFSHVYVEASPAGEWIALDATEREPAGWAPPDVITRLNQGI